MSSYDETVYQPSPASSSDVVDSIRGTPYTSLTALSPEDVRVMKSGAVNIGGNLAGSNHDPFVSSNTQTGGKLSAKASTFKPSLEMRAAAANASVFAIEPSQEMHTPISSHYGELTRSESPHGAPHEASPTHVGVFTSDSNISRVLKITGKNSVATFLSSVEVSKRKLRERGIAKRGSERPEQLGNAYYLRLANVRDATELYAGIKMDNPGLMIEYVSPATFSQLFGPIKYSVHEGQVFLTVKSPMGLNIEHGALVHDLAQMLQTEGKLWAWHKITASPDGTFYMLAEFEDADCASGVLTDSRKINNNPKLQNFTVSVELFQPDLAEETYPQQNNHPDTPTRYQGEHINLNNAFGNISLDNVTPSPVGTGIPYAGIATASRPPYMTTSSSHPMLNALPYVVGNPNNMYMPAVANSFQQAYPPGINAQANVGLGEAPHYSFRGRSYTQGSIPQRGFNPNAEFEQSQFSNGYDYYNQGNYNQGNYNQGNYNQGLHGHTREIGQYGRPSGRRQYTPRAQNSGMRSRQHSSPANTHHNHVDISKIKQGIDVRTTVMLRNIPNKVDQAMLKEIVDESSFGRYDFMYLRIDFSNNCNVGYAFINFTDPLDIVDFVVARSNQKWHTFKSDKVAEVSYATIQGKDCLVQKFRNSSVMLEPPHYRPKLFKTIHDEFGHAGEEERFPESDNASKLKRSCENAEHVGLFAPSAGQHLRDEQRRRRSQYDRGTSLAEREEYGLDDAFYTPFGFPPY